MKMKGKEKKSTKNEVMPVKNDEVIVNDKTTSTGEENTMSLVSKPKVDINDESSFGKTNKLSPEDEKSQAVPAAEDKISTSQGVKSDIVPEEEEAVSSSKDLKSEVVPTEEEVKLSPEDKKSIATPAAKEVESLVGDIKKEHETQYVYAVGRLCPKFPSRSERKEYERVAADISQQTSSTAVQFYDVLSKPENFYLAKSFCWVFEIDGIETYIVIPADSTQLKTFISILKPVTTAASGEEPPLKLDTIVGKLGQTVSSETCNGRELPAVQCHRMETFSFDAFTDYIKDETDAPSIFVKSMFRNMLRLTDNNGSSGVHRAINFIVFSYIDLYRILRKRLSTNSDNVQPLIFEGVTAKENVEGSRKKIEVAFKFEDTETTKQELLYCEVDVTNMYPFMIVNQTSANLENQK